MKPSKTKEALSPDSTRKRRHCLTAFSTKQVCTLQEPKEQDPDQKQRAEILFNLYPDIRAAYKLSQQLNWIFETTKEKIYAHTRLAKWHEQVERSGFKSFNTIAQTIMNHYKTNLNYFNNRSTNASSESLNAKIKAFRAQFRGVRNTEFFLFRLSQIYD